MQGQCLIASHQSLLILIGFSQQDYLADCTTVLEIELPAAVVQQICLVLIECLNAVDQLIGEELTVGLELKH